MSKDVLPGVESVRRPCFCWCKLNILITLGGKAVARESNQESSARVELEINGEEVELNDFVGNFISQTVIGMVKSLRGVGEVETIRLEILREAE